MGENAGKYTAIKRQCFLTASVALNIIGHGCVIGFSAILIPSLRKPESTIVATPSEESWIASIVGVALVVGNIIITLIIDSIGRKKSHFITIVPVLVGWFLFLVVNNVAGLIAVRFLQGIAMGMLGPLGSIIIGEMTDPKYRGMFLTSVSLSLTIGVLFCHSLGTYFTWQQSAIICSFTTFASLTMIFFTKESPSWLIKRKRYDEARDVFFYMRGHGETQENELESMITSKKLESNDPSATNLSFSQRIRGYGIYFKKTCKKPEFFKPIIIMLFMYTMFQFAGINVFSSYATDIIRQVVGPEVNAEIMMVALDVERLLCNLLAVLLMKTLKRRTLLFGSGTICILSYFGKALYVYLKQENKLTYTASWIPITLIALYMFSLTVGISSIPFALSGELFPLEYRGFGSGISILALSLNFFSAVKCFPVLIESIGLPLTYVFYASIVLICLTVIFFMLPETKDKTLQEIENRFRGITAEDARSAQPLNNKSNEMRRVSSVIMY